MMCEFISWIETKDTVLFITDADLNSKEGRALIKDLGPQYADDICGHGAIRKLYGINAQSGVNRECTDFSAPDNFPPAIAEAIKRGQFSRIGIAEGLLTQTAWAEYQKVEQTAWAEYQKAKQTALAEYQKAKQTAFWEFARAPENRIEVWR